MKILLLCGNFLPKVGGLSIMMHYLACALIDAGHAIQVAPGPREAPDFDQPYELLGGDPKSWAVGPAHKRRGREQHLADLLTDTAREFGAEAMLLGDQLYGGPWAYAAVEARKRLNIPVGVYAHGLDVASTLYGGDATWRQAGARLVGPFFGAGSTRRRTACLTDAADVIFANSSATAGLVKEWRGRDAVVTGCGLADADYEREASIVPAFSRESKQHWRSELGLSQRPTVSFVGRLAARKNVELILKALAQNVEMQAVIVGEGSRRPALEALTSQLGIDDRVHWWGAQPEQTKWQVLRASDVSCLPAITGPKGDIEGFGIALLEAAAAGTPVIAAANGGMLDVVTHQRTGLLCTGDDATQLAQQLRRFCDDDELAGRCVANARRQIRERYNWPRIAEMITDQLSTAAEGRPTPTVEADCERSVARV